MAGSTVSLAVLIFLWRQVITTFMRHIAYTFNHQGRTIQITWLTTHVAVRVRLTAVSSVFSAYKATTLFSRHTAWNRKVLVKHIFIILQAVVLLELQSLQKWWNRFRIVDVGTILKILVVIIGALGSSISLCLVIFLGVHNLDCLLECFHLVELFLVHPYLLIWLHPQGLFKCKFIF